MERTLTTPFESRQQPVKSSPRTPLVSVIVPAHNAEATVVETIDSVLCQTCRDFYRGDLARRMVEYLGPRGCEISLEDLAGHRSDWVEPIGITYAGTTLLEIPPNGQGPIPSISMMRKTINGG